MTGESHMSSLGPGMHMARKQAKVRSACPQSLSLIYRCTRSCQAYGPSGPDPYSGLGILACHADLAH